VTATQPPATRRTWPKLVVGLLLIGLPVAAVAATANNWFEPLVGRLYTRAELRAAEDSARNDGRSKGYDDGFTSGKSVGYTDGRSAGYREGRSSGYDEGVADGVVRGCVAVFDAMNSYVLYDSPSYLATSYIGRSTCYG
jgi:hypothetical protein